MSLSYHYIDLLPTESLCLASQMVSLADGVNSRLERGAGDVARRIFLYTYNHTRQIRGYPSDPLQNPSEAEFPFWEAFVDDTSTPWPPGDPADDQGSNNGNPICQFVLGIQTGDGPQEYVVDPYTNEPYLMGEGDRINDKITTVALDDPDAWIVGGDQCGLIDTASNYISAPAWEAAQGHLRTAFSERTKYEQSVGAYMPVPEQGGTCDDGRIDYILKFAPLAGGNTATCGDQDVYCYHTCGPDQGGATTDAAYLVYGPFGFVVYLFDGSSIEFPYNQFKIILDGGGILGRVRGNQYNRLMLTPFLKSWRGTDSQRPKEGNYDIREVAFDYSRFFNSQHQLAPQFGVYDPNTDTISNDGYHLSHSFQSGTAESSSVTMSVHEHFCTPRIFGLGMGLAKECKVEIWENTEHPKLWSTFTIPTGALSPLNELTGSKFDIYDVGITGSWCAKLPQGAEFKSASGSIYIEGKELLQYQPEWYDAYLITRSETSKNLTADLDGEDQEGENFTRANEITYFDYGCILNINGGVETFQQQTALNTNPVYQSMRKYYNSFCKVIHNSDIIGSSATAHGPSLLVAAEKNETGSCLYFKPTIQGNQFPIFGGMVDLNDSASNIITATAPAAGWSNEWVMVQINKLVEYNNATSTWKPTLYADYYGYVNRAHIMSHDIQKNYNGDLWNYIQNYGGSTLNAGPVPETLTVLNYAGADLVGGTYTNVNAGCDAQFYKSNQVYPDPYNVVECKYVTLDGQLLVKVQFDSYLQAHEDEEALFISDKLTWNVTDINTEDYRTDSNAVREFILEAQTLKDGDVAYNNDQLDANPVGGYPTFIFIKKVPKPFIGNDAPNTELTASAGCPLPGSVSSDHTILTAYPLQLSQLYAVACCDGFIAGQVSIDNACTSMFNNAFEYNEQLMCQDAFSRNNFSIIDSNSTFAGSLNSGCGPLPNQEILRTHYNETAAAWNLLNKVRLPLPFMLQGRTYDYIGVAEYTSEYPSFDDCGGNARFVKLQITPPDANTLDTSQYPQPSDWGTYDGTVAFQTWDYLVEGGAAGISSCGTNNTFLVQRRRRETEYRFELFDPLARNSVSDDLWNLITTGQGGFYGLITDNQINRYTMTETATPDNDCPGDMAGLWYDATKGVYYTFTTIPDPVGTLCKFYTDGMILPDACPVSDGGVVWTPQAATQADRYCAFWPGTRKDMKIRSTRDPILTIPYDNPRA